MATKRLLSALMLLCYLLPAPGAADNGAPVTLSVRNSDITEVMQMLSRSNRVNILLAPEVVGKVSFSLYEVPLAEAIRSIANTAGFAVEQRNGTYFVLGRDNAGQYADSDMTQLRTFAIQYADTATIQTMLTPYLSGFGKVTALPARRILVVEDTPPFMDRLAALIDELDRAPRQILIEAQILEVTLNEEDSWGVDWSDLFARNNGDASIGTRGLAGAGGSGNSGFLLSIDNADVIATLTALEQDGRVRTLSTPKLLALENQEASVIVGDRRGYQVTTTINQISTESIEFLESGVILRVTPTVDANDKIMMDIHPEVSTGTVDGNGIPSQTTTEVTTRLLVNSGETVFVGGLIKQSMNNQRSGVPGVSRLPGIGRLFSSRESTSVNTETVVLIKPVLVESDDSSWSLPTERRVNLIEDELDSNQAAIDREVAETFRQIQNQKSQTSQ